MADGGDILDSGWTYREARAAEERCPPWASARTLPRGPLLRWAMTAAMATAAGALTDPALVVAVLALIATLTLVLATGLKLAAFWVAVRHRGAVGAPDDAGPHPRPTLPTPVVTILVPLYREGAVAATILGRVAALDYPREALDLILLLEDDDADTRAALAAVPLPAWARVLELPEGTLRTKPRALNFGLSYARGEIVGIYDAEDVPAPDHVRRVAAAFAAAGPDLACVQGQLDYFNASSGWLARCFALEYAAWFRVILPGVNRLGLVTPLGGTTLFLRRAAIEAVGGWDAHNVTEDADLGVRLARAGLRTAVLPIVTLEEANARAWPWVRQRSRWLKGYAQTYAVHMRDPRRLWRELGPVPFLAFQVQFAGTLAGFALAPLLWTFLLVPLGLHHPLAPMLPPVLLTVLSVLFGAVQGVDLTLAWAGAARSGHRRLWPWALLLPFYFLLATLAAWRALWEVALCPFRWDKTEHGIDPPVAAGRAPA